MHNFFWIALACWSWITVSNSIGVVDPQPASTASASECAISVDLSGGRTFSAVLDARTDAERLWLRFGQPDAEILRPIHWDHVVSAELAGQKLSGGQLHRLVVLLRRELPAQSKGFFDGKKIEMIGATSNISQVSQETDLPANSSRVVSLAIDVRVGRWDENVDPDGLVVRISPLGADGSVIPIRGTLAVDLKVGLRGKNMLRQPFVNAGHWTESVSRADFGPGGAVYRLRFQGINPEFDDHAESPGLVHACLTVPGQGTFEASTYLSAIRPFNPVRNHLQATTRHGYFPGYRYFANERTGAGRR